VNEPVQRTEKLWSIPLPREPRRSSQINPAVDTTDDGRIEAGAVEVLSLQANSVWPSRVDERKVSGTGTGTPSTYGAPCA